MNKQIKASTPLSFNRERSRTVNVGDIVRLLKPYKPESETEHCRQIFNVSTLQRGFNARRSRSFNSLHQSLAQDKRKWLGFTHGIVVEIISGWVDGTSSHVSLHLYDPATGLIYMCNPSLHPVPTYVDLRGEGVRIGAICARWLDIRYRTV